MNTSRSDDGELLALQATHFILACLWVECKIGQWGHLTGRGYLQAAYSSLLEQVVVDFCRWHDLIKIVTTELDKTMKFNYM